MAKDLGRYILKQYIQTNKGWQRTLVKWSPLLLAEKLPIPPGGKDRIEWKRPLPTCVQRSAAPILSLSLQKHLHTTVTEGCWEPYLFFVSLTICFYIVFLFKFALGHRLSRVRWYVDFASAKITTQNCHGTLDCRICILCCFFYFACTKLAPHSCHFSTGPRRLSILSFYITALFEGRSQ